MKLTRTWKLDAIDNILKVKTEKEFKKIDEDFREFGVKYVEKQNEPFQKRIEALPIEFFNIKDFVTFYYGKGHTEYEGVDLKKAFVFVNNNSYHSPKITLKGKDKTDFLKIIKVQKELLKFKEELRQELFKVIMACTTDKILLNVFPEIEKYITFPNKQYPIMVKTDKLLSMLESD